MKKYFIGLAAMLLALGAVAFTPKPKHADGLYYFRVQPNNSAFTETIIPKTQTAPICGESQPPYCSAGLTEDQVDPVGSDSVARKTIYTPSDGIPDFSED